MISGIPIPDLSGWIEIICLWAVFYYLLFSFRGTRAVSVLTGFVLVVVGLIAITRGFHLDALNWLFGRLSVYLAVAFLVIFQPEIRKGLADLGKRHFFFSNGANQTLIDQIIEAVVLLSNRRIGALIAIERDIGTRPYQESGVQIDSAVTPELLAGIFFPYTPLHDGGAIICNNRIVAARCMLPLSQQANLSKTIGTRHRAALGLSEETDAVVIVVSEETGMISIAHESRLVQHLDGEQLRTFLTHTLVKAQPAPTHRRWLRRRRHSAEPKSATDMS